MARMSVGVDFIWRWNWENLVTISSSATSKMDDLEPMTSSSWVFTSSLMKEDFGEKGLRHCIKFFQSTVEKLNAYRGLADNSNKSRKLRVKKTWPQHLGTIEKGRNYKPSTAAECCLEGMCLSVSYILNFAEMLGIHIFYEFSQFLKDST